MVGGGSVSVEVDQKLVASRAAHDLKKRKAGVIDKTGAVIAQPDYPAAEQCLVEALRLRLEAHDLDPEHTSAGWALDKAPDAELIRFYVAYCRPHIPRALLAQVFQRFPAYREIVYIP